MSALREIAGLEPVAVARARVTRTDGRREVHYSTDVPLWKLGSWLKVRRHVRFMRAEDRKDGYA